MTGTAHGQRGPYRMLAATSIAHGRVPAAPMTSPATIARTMTGSRTQRETVLISAIAPSSHPAKL